MKTFSVTSLQWDDRYPGLKDVDVGFIGLFIAFAVLYILEVC